MTRTSVSCAPRHKNHRRTAIQNQFYHHVPRLNILKNGDGYEVQIAIPGIDKSLVNIQTEDSKLIISHNRSEGRKQNYLSKGFDLSGFSRTIELPKDIDLTQIRARHQEGLLHILLPIAESAKPKSITIS